MIEVLALSVLASSISCRSGERTTEQNARSSSDDRPLKIEYIGAGMPLSSSAVIPLVTDSVSGRIRISVYHNPSIEVVIHQTGRNYFTEINGKLINLSGSPSCGTLRIIKPYSGVNWKWFSGLGGSVILKNGETVYDTVRVVTVLPPDGAFNGNDLSEGGYGDPVGRGTMSYYPLCAAGIDDKGAALGVDMSLPVVYRLGAEKGTGLIAELDLATSAATAKFPDRAFFRLCSFGFSPEWGMRAALERYYGIYPEAFRKRVVNEGIWLPFTPLRSIPGWQDFGIAFHETSWGSTDTLDGGKVPNIISDKGTGILSFQYTEPWDLQLPVKDPSVPYDAVVGRSFISDRHLEYMDASTTRDKNGKWQARRLKTPWFSTGWAVSITTNCDPDLPGFNKYRYVLEDEINPALRMDADGIYFDSMEWNWHHDLNYREDHFEFTDYPLTFSGAVGKPAIWNFASEFEFMKKISDEMHIQGKLAMGNGHGWNPFAASNLDLFGAELSWYSAGDHNTEALDFKRAISAQKPIVFLLNEGLNDKAFNEPPYEGYVIYFEKMLAYGFFPSFFSVDASSDPYWQDRIKIENGRPFFKKYIPVIKKIAAAGWEPVTYATCDSTTIRVERFGNKGNLFFTVRNNGANNFSGDVEIESCSLGITGSFRAKELLSGKELKADNNKVWLEIPAGRTMVLELVE